MGNIVIQWAGGRRVIRSSGGANVLDEALAAGIPVTHSCRRGDCYQCEASVVESDNPSLQPGEMVRLCQTQVEASASFELMRDPFQNAAPVRTYPAKVKAIDRIAEGVIRLTLITPPGAPLEFRGGQYATIRLGSGIERDYSIAAVDATTREATFYIQPLPDGLFSNWLNNAARPGEMLQLRGPQGSFALSEQPVEATWFVATGTGIVPIYALLTKMTEEQSGRCGRMTVLWGNKHRQNLFLVDALESCCQAHGIDLRLVFTRDESQVRQRVTDVLAQADLKEAAVYASGFSQVINDVRAVALARGLSGRRFFTDVFLINGRGETK